MRVVCEGCQAKYSIADEKVAGRAFKIRCKRCGAPISVRARPNVTAIWHVQAGAEQLGPLSDEQLFELADAGTLDGDCYVWREGYDEWKPAREVEELAAKFRAEPFAPAESALTASRNETSVLFSLNNLRELSTAGKNARPADVARPSGDGSGLIDIRALAAADREPKAKERVDDLLAIGPGMSLGALAAPVILPDSKPRSNKALIVFASSSAAIMSIAAAITIAVVATHEKPHVVRVEPVRPAVIQTPPEVVREEPPAITTVAVVQPVAQPVAHPTVRRPHERPRVEQPRQEEPHDRSIEALIDESLDPRRPTERPEPPHEGPATPSRSDVVGAMSSVSSAVRACGDGATHGLAPVHVVFGSEGRVTNAEVSSSELPAGVRTCISRAVRNARVPRFAQRTFRVQYPFRI